MSDIYPEIAAATEEQLRKENSDLKQRVATLEQALEDAGLELDHKHVPDEIRTLNTQIGKLAEMSDKGIPFDLETVKTLEILIKSKAVALGKVAPDEKPKRKEKKATVAELLVIAGEKKFERD